MPTDSLAKVLRTRIPKAQVETVQQSQPELDLATPEVVELENASFLHLVRTMEQVINGLQAVILKLDILARNVEREHTFIDVPTQLGLTIGYTVDYQQRKFLFIYSSTGCTLALPDGSTKTVSAHTWTNISLPRGWLITQSSGNDQAPINVIVRACDVLMSTT